MSEPLVNVITPADRMRSGSSASTIAKILLDIPAGDTSNDANCKCSSTRIRPSWPTRPTAIRFAKEKVRSGGIASGRCAARMAPARSGSRMRRSSSPISRASNPGGHADRSERLSARGAHRENHFPRRLQQRDPDHLYRRILLPEEAPLDLQQAAGLMVQQFQTQAAQAATGGSGMRMLAHKDSRIMYFSPKDMAGGNGASSAGAGHRSRNPRSTIC